MNLLKSLLNVADPIIARSDKDEPIYTKIKKHRTPEEKQQIEFLYNKIMGIKN